ncbi:transposase family protein [Streptomyces sp. NPDC021093]|uniref:transposase family protein n=1 Tax=Streptomyces sp. NPDC021093 TaxID=3365112 RepID=UPI003799530E
MVVSRYCTLPETFSLRISSNRRYAASASPRRPCTTGSGPAVRDSVLDGTLVRCDRTGGETARGTDLWYAIRIKHFAGNVQFLATSDGTPLWVSEVEPGSTHDLVATRIHALPDLYRAARDGLPTLADIGYLGAGGGIHVPVRKHPDLPGDIGFGNQTYNKLLRGLCFPGERAMAVLKQRWRTLQHVTLSPSRIGAITQAALVLNNAWR